MRYVIASATESRSAAHAWRSYAELAAADGNEDSARMFRESAAMCDRIADAVDAGTVVPGEYYWTGTYNQFTEALFSGHLAPHFASDAA